MAAGPGDRRFRDRHHFRRRDAEGRVSGRRDRAGNRHLDGGAVPPGFQAAAGGLREARARGGTEHGRLDAERPRLRVCRTGGRHLRADEGRARLLGEGDRHRRAGAVDRVGLEADRSGGRPAHAGRPEDHLPTQRWREMMPDNDDDRPELPRGATPSELDALRATVRVTPRSQPLANAPRPTIAPSPTTALVHRGDVDRILDEGRSLLDLDPRAAHEIFEKAWRRNLNDPRVLSNYGLTLVLVEGDRQRGIRFCEEALRRGLQTTETLVNMARALVVTRNKEQAVRALRKAMELSPDDPRVSAEFAALGLRRPPPIPWLPRSFFLNKWIGKLTRKLSRPQRLHPAPPASRIGSCRGPGRRRRPPRRCSTTTPICSPPRTSTWRCWC